jgi:hypothetical protein
MNKYLTIEANKLLDSAKKPEAASDSSFGRKSHPVTVSSSAVASQILHANQTPNQVLTETIEKQRRQYERLTPSDKARSPSPVLPKQKLG